MNCNLKDIFEKLQQWIRISSYHSTCRCSIKSNNSLYRTNKVPKESEQASFIWKFHVWSWISFQSISLRLHCIRIGFHIILTRLWQCKTPIHLSQNIGHLRHFLPLFITDFRFRFVGWNWTFFASNNSDWFTGRYSTAIGASPVFNFRLERTIFEL